TSTEQEVASWQLRDAGALDYFDVMICGDMVVNSKPDPEIFLKACQGLGVRPADAFVVEDAFSGVRAAHAAGARTIMVPDQVQPTDEIAALAEVVLPSMDAAREYMAQFL
ncbi:MAG: HAD family hydrolase, partial [Clostridia bacterium]|nr:HAD family hydrolase [Clostridia bacterium]